MAEPFLTNGCEPIDDNGHLTSCFIQNLDTGAIGASELFKISYEKIKPKLENDLKWVFDLCRKAAADAKFRVVFPHVEAIESGEELADYIKHWESRGATVSTSVNLRATMTTCTLGMKNLTSNHITFLKDLGYTVTKTSPPVGSFNITHNIHLISWDKE